MENNAEVSNVEINNIEEKPHYIGVIFENKYSGKQFSGKVYEYKTLKPLKEGQIITIQTMYGESKVCVVKENIPEDELQYKDIDNIKEI